MMDDYKRVEVEWLDALGGSRDERTVEQLKNIPPFLTKSIGWLVHADETCVRLVTTRGIDGMNFDWLIIPKGMIQKITELKEAQDELDALSENERIAFYDDAKDKPEKHPELVKDFEKELDLPKSLPARANMDNYDYVVGVLWRDWLFKKIIKGDD